MAPRQILGVAAILLLAGCASPARPPDVPNPAVAPVASNQWTNSSVSGTLVSANLVPNVGVTVLGGPGHGQEGFTVSAGARRLVVTINFMQGSPTTSTNMYASPPSCQLPAHGCGTSVPLGPAGGNFL